MTVSDVVLKNDSVIVTGNLGVGTEAPNAALHVEGGSGILTSGTAAGYAFMDRTKPAQRWVWYATDECARLFKDRTGDIITASQWGEVLTRGSGAGYAFMDRTKPTQRWVWYASDETARLFADGVGDILTVDRNALVVHGKARAGAVETGVIEGTFMGARLAVRAREIHLHCPTDDPSRNVVARLFAFDPNASTLEICEKDDTRLVHIGCKVNIRGDLDVQGRLTQALAGGDPVDEAEPSGKAAAMHLNAKSPPMPLRPSEPHLSTATRLMTDDEATDVIRRLKPTVYTTPVLEASPRHPGGSFAPNSLSDMLGTQDGESIDILSVLAALTRVVQSQEAEIAALKAALPSTIGKKLQPQAVPPGQP